MREIIQVIVEQVTCLLFVCFLNIFFLFFSNIYVFIINLFFSKIVDIMGIDILAQ